MPNTILQQTLTNIPGDLGVTTIYMPVVDAFVVVHFYMSSPGVLNRQPRFSWQDQNGGQSVVVPKLPNALYEQSFSMPFKIKAGTTLSLSTEGAQLNDLAATIQYAIDLY